jgi:antitoxin component HigA of HigAB toxin-antitoxin module
MKTFSVEGALPRSYARLVALLPPMAIQDDIHHGNTVAMIDRLMQVSHLSAGQAAYLETLVELVESYEAKRQALDLARISPRQMLRHVLQEAGLSGSDLARLLGIHPSMGSKLAKGDRRVAWEHALTLGRHFHVSPALFMDA